MKISELSNEDLNEQLARALGWTECRIIKSVKIKGKIKVLLHTCIDPQGEPKLGIPDWASDLNAIQEDIQGIAPTEDDLEYLSGSYIKYLCNLCRIVGQDEYGVAQFAWPMVNATARQRAEALLEVLSNKELA